MCYYYHHVSDLLDNGMYSAKAIANWFIQKSIDEYESVDQIKLMKLVYIAQGIGLATGHRLLQEPIEAWKYGPVIPSLYEVFKHSGLEKIDQLIAIPAKEGSLTVAADDTKTLQILDAVWSNLGKFSGIVLSNWSHDEDGPWFKVRQKGGEDQYHYPIDEKEIGQYFHGFRDKISA